MKSKEEKRKRKEKVQERKKRKKGGHCAICTCCLKNFESWPNMLQDEEKQMRELEEAWPEAGSTQSLQ